MLKQYFKEENPAAAIIFCNSRRNGELLFRKLKGVVNSLEYIHGGLDQGKRTSIFNRFKQGKIKVMIATDVAGRGLDFSRVTHIFNYDFPGCVRKLRTPHRPHRADGQRRGSDLAGHRPGSVHGQASVQGKGYPGGLGRQGA